MGPLSRLLGVRRKRTSKGGFEFLLTVRRDHMNPYGLVHGGVVYSLADYAMGAELARGLGPGERCATLEIKINYLAPVADGTLRAEARVVERTRRIGVLEGRVYDHRDRLVALATGSFYIQAER
jgi:acyl-CoA thioesterase